MELDLSIGSLMRAGSGVLTVRLALRDRVMRREEERHLFRLARGLGLSPVRAHEILVEVEAAGQADREPATGGAPS